MRTLVVGATGLLGHALWRSWRARPGWSSTGTSRAARAGLERLELCDPKGAGALIAAVKPQAVIIAASEPHVDFCETDPAGTRRVNVEATLDLARAARAAGAKVVFFSSDYVFDGSRGAWTEDDAPRPLNEYGRQKLAVETELSGWGSDALTVRVSGLFGWEFKPRNFVLRARENLAAGKALRVPADQVYCPTYVGHLAERVAALLERGASGLYHLAGSEPFGRDAWARAVAAEFSLDSGLVTGAPTALLPPAPAPRPLRSDLVSAKAAALLGGPVPGGRAGLAAMRAEAADWLPGLKALAGGAS